MITRTLATRCAVTLVLLGLAGPARAADSDNLQLFRSVQRQVLRYTHFTIFDNVSAQVDNGTVVLDGKVTMPYKLHDLERRVRAVTGVTAVDNRIEVLPVSQFDDELRLRIARAIYTNSAFRPFASMVNPPIHIIVERGRVTLEGVVLNNVDRVIARSIASSFLAFKLTNNLKTEKEVETELEKL
jgi:hyperosmotically inducible protein